MIDIPQESKGSFKEGIWFVFQHLGFTIVAGGKINGKEFVYVNGELVSEKRSIKTNNKMEQIRKVDCPSLFSGKGGELWWSNTASVHFPEFFS